MSPTPPSCQVGLPKNCPSGILGHFWGVKLRRDNDLFCFATGCSPPPPDCRRREVQIPPTTFLSNPGQIRASRMGGGGWCRNHFALIRHEGSHLFQETSRQPSSEMPRCFSWPFVSRNSATTSMGCFAQARVCRFVAIWCAFGPMSHASPRDDLRVLVRISSCGHCGSSLVQA